MTTVRVRYMVNDLESAITFYTKHLGFQVAQQAKPNFAMLSLGNLDLVLSTPFGPGGAAKPMSDGSKPEPGGSWNRLIINVDNLEKEIERLRKAQVHFRNDIATGPGGAEILLDDPSGNPVELFQPAAADSSDDEAAIRALEDNLAAAISSGDIDAIMKNYTPGNSFIIFDVVPRKEYRGADTYRNYWLEMFTHFKGTFKFSITDLGITVDGNTGFGHSFQHVKGTDTHGRPVDRTVMVTNGYRKIGGKWLIALEHVSVPVDFATGKLVPVTKP
ncbi:MAG TPA: nuclear transport factor 2 family protein [Chitinophagaceae bacterium]|nr:nuclear transport factor 2 family protein [Chitinophagaceae bacterium]